MRGTTTYRPHYPYIYNDTHTISGSIYHSIHPADDIKAIIENDKNNVNDPNIKISLLPDSYVPTKIASYASDSLPFQIIANSALEIYPDAKVIPGMLVVPGGSGFTDSGTHYWNLTENIYRFSPMLMTNEDMGRYHGRNERISVMNYNQV